MAVLYFYIVILWLSNTANGFDGSMMNGLQVLHYWSDYFGHPHGSLLGLFSSIFSVGSVVALVFFPYGTILPYLLFSIVLLNGLIGGSEMQ